MASKLSIFSVKTLTEFRDSLIRTYRNGLIRLGISSPDTSPGSEPYLWSNALAQELAILANNAVLKAEAQMPDSATGADLERLARIVGLSRHDAGGSLGYAVLTSSVSPISIAVDSELMSPTGVRVKVSVGGSYSTADLIPIASISTGTVTNLAAGTILSWLSPPAFVDSKSAVGVGGLTGGVDAETDEDLRARVLEKYSNPPGTGNWSQLNLLAESGDKTVQKSFCYPCANGPSTVHLAVTGAPTATNKSRFVDALPLSMVEAVVVGNVPEYVEAVVTTVTGLNTDVTIGLALPASQSASPAGPGGGWLDGTPFPAPVSNKSDVTSVTSTTVFAVNSAVAPTAGVSHVAWLSPITWTLHRAKVLSYAGSASPYTITIDTAFPDIAIGQYLMPDAEQLDTYVDAVLDQFASMGPGQKTNLAGLLPRAYRKPLVSLSWASDLGPSVLKFLSSSGEEVLDVQYLYKSATSPPIPTLITDPPQILVPNKLAFYAL